MHCDARPIANKLQAAHVLPRPLSAMPTEETDVILSAMPAMLTVDVPNTIIITSDTTDTNIRYEYYLRNLHLRRTLP